MNKQYENNHFHFYTPSKNAKSLLYYPLVAGRFVCDETYLVKRNSYDSILAMYILDGSMVLEQNGQTFVAGKGELLLVDCYLPHKYYTNGYATTLWVHFDGGNSRALFHELTKKGQALSADLRCRALINDVIDGGKNNLNEYVLSALIYSLLCALSAVDTSELKDNSSLCVQAAKEYMQNNFEQNLTVAQIAKAVHFSASHFSKVFKDSTGDSPYAYLTNIRIAKAKTLLTQTTLPISIVACRVGFNSTENFIYYFKQKTALTPLQFRKTVFY